MIASREDYAISREVMHKASKNYSFASRFLPQDKLHHVEALYAFLRVGDDRVDVSHQGFDSPLAAIDHWEQLYWQAFESGSSPDPVMRAYLNTALECDIPPEIMKPFFRAMKEDLSVTRFPTFQHLLHYMEGSAMAVGRGMTYILGVKAPHHHWDVMPYADALAIAMQLSNFWRDIAYDWSIGRVYIPQEDLEHFGVRESDLAKQNLTPQLVALLQFEIERTEQYYQQALKGIPMLASGQWGVRSGWEIYRAILTNIQRNNFDVFARRASASDWHKFGLIARAWWHTKKQ